MLKNILKDPVIYFLLAVNIGLALMYFQQLISRETILYTYYFQSLTIGLSHFIQILTIKHYSVKDLLINGKQVDRTFRTKGCVGIFFLIHYGFFHLVYIIFLLIYINFPSDSTIILSSVIAFSIGEIAGIIRQNTISRNILTNIGTLMFTPYLRIIPIHLFIMAGGFLGFDHPHIFAVFIILKILSDTILHIIIERTYESGPKDKTPPIIQL